MKNLKIPRKLKKEIVKVESIVKQPYWVNPQSFGVQLKSGVKVNKWTVKLINKIIAEQKKIVRKVYSSNLENMKAQIDSLSFVSEVILNDKQLQQLHAKRAEIYSLATPTVILGKDSKAETVWIDETHHPLLPKINEMIEQRTEQIKQWFQ